MGKDKPPPDKPPVPPVPPVMPDEPKPTDPSPLPAPPPPIVQKPETADDPVVLQNLTLEEKLDILAEKARRRRSARQPMKILTQIDLPAVDENTIKEVKKKRTRKTPRAAPPTEGGAPAAEEPQPEAAPAEAKSEAPAKPRKPRAPKSEKDPSDAVQIAELQATIVRLNDELKELKRKLSKKEPKAPKEAASKTAAPADEGEDEIALFLPDNDRRKYIRFKAEHVKLLVFRVGLLEKLGMSRNIGRALVDISQGGCSAIVVKEVEPYTAVRMIIEMPRFKQTLELAGEVRWCSKLSRDHWETGVVFTALTPSDAGILKNWVVASSI